VVTTAPLATGKPYEGELCIKGCQKCVDACPVGALKSDGELDRQRCWERVSSKEERYGYAICASCIAACPVGMPDLK
jgi:epoxyqueuosine reductase QueG